MISGEQFTRQKRERMKEKGSITIYLTLILLSILLIISLITESARMNMVQTEVRSFTQMGVESVMAGYTKELYKDYGILAVWEKEPADEILEGYIESNLSMSDVDTSGTNFLSTVLSQVNISSQEYITDNGGDSFVEQILSYMKYAEMDEIAEEILNLKDSCETDTSEGSSNVETLDPENLDTSELSLLTEEINSLLENIKDKDSIEENIELLKDLLSDGKKNKTAAAYKALVDSIDEKSSNTETCVEKIKEYKKLRDDLLSANNISSQSDYMDENYTVLNSLLKMIGQINSEEAEYLELVSSCSDVSELESELTEKPGEIISIIDSLQIVEIDSEDEECKSIYEQACDLINTGVLSLILSDTSSVSTNYIDITDVPSKTDMSENEDSLLKSELNKMMLIMYDSLKFGNYTNPAEEGALEYGMEYILCGKDSDIDNLASAFEKMATSRNVLTLAYLVTDSSKMAEIETVSSSVSAALGLPFMEPIIKLVLTEAWALAEAVNDIKILAAGKSIKICKTKNTWNTELSDLLNGSRDEYEGSDAVDYEKWLCIMLLTTGKYKVIYRTMDLIEVNMKKDYISEFSLSECFQEMTVIVEYTSAPVFTAMSWCILALSENNGSYDYSIGYQYEYS